MNQCTKMQHTLLVFNSMFPFPLCCCSGPLRQYDSTILTTPEASLQEHVVPYQLPRRLTLRNMAVRLLRNYTCIFTMRISLFGIIYGTTYKYIHTNILTYIHTYIQTPFAFNTIMWASLKLTPIKDTMNNLSYLRIQ